MQGFSDDYIAHVERSLPAADSCGERQAAIYRLVDRYSPTRLSSALAALVRAGRAVAMPGPQRVAGQPVLLYRRAPAAARERSERA